MEVTTHGGQCCGIRHLRNFGGPDEGCLHELKRFLRTEQSAISQDAKHLPVFDFVQFTSSTGKRGKIIEVVLTERQIERLPLTCAYLKGYGFKLVSRFHNSTGNICNVLHYCYDDRLSEQGAWERVAKRDIEQLGKRLPQRGEVWRINANTHHDQHHFNKNQYVVCCESDSTPSGRYKFKALHPQGHQVKTQSVPLADISFIRDSK